jgi:hypothetical protein
MATVSTPPIAFSTAFRFLIQGVDGGRRRVEVEENDDIFHGVRFLTAKSVRTIDTLDYLPSASRSRSFALPQRTQKRPNLVALFHATSAHRILVFRAFLHPACRTPFREPLLSCRFGYFI